MVSRIIFYTIVQLSYLKKKSLPQRNSLHVIHSFLSLFKLNKDRQYCSNTYKSHLLAAQAVSFVLCNMTHIRTMFILLPFSGMHVCSN